MAIYTKTGDNGQTSLASGQRVPKTDARIEAYGTVDELNSWIGLVRAGVQYSELFTDRVQTELTWIQNRLFNLGAALSDAPGEWITQTDVKFLEQSIDAIQDLLPKQHGFILPDGDETAIRAHVARTVCRRAERRMIDAAASEIQLQFINRLSDYLFVLSRLINDAYNQPELLWQKDFDVEKLTE